MARVGLQHHGKKKNSFKRLKLLTCIQDSSISKLSLANECRYLEFRRVFLDGFQASFTIHNSLNLIFVVPCIMLYSGEISSTRCNKCVFYSQWLYSTYFG